MSEQKARLNRITITSWQKVDIPKRRTKSNTKKAEICHAGREITQPNCGNVPTCLSEKKNGSTYREHIIGLPRELNQAQRMKLVKEWVVNEMGTNKPYSLAIHNTIASDGQEQPHLHLMFCERLQDGIERTPQQFFKRYNSKDPSKGGCQKDNTGKTPQQRELEIKAQRLRWQEMANRHLVEAGF